MSDDKSASRPIKYFENQFDDEEVLLVFRRHPIVMRKGLIVSMVSWLIGPLIVLILTYIRPDNPPSMLAFFLALGASIVFGSLLLLPSWISWYFSVFIITSQRFVQITQKGLFHTTYADLTLSQIQQINYEIAGLQETLLGFGTIKVQTYIGDVVIHDVSHPAKTQAHIVRILRDQGVAASELPFRRTDMPEQAND